MHCKMTTQNKDPDYGWFAKQQGRGLRIQL